MGGGVSPKIRHWLPSQAWSLWLWLLTKDGWKIKFDQIHFDLIFVAA